MENSEQKILFWLEDISLYLGISKKLQEQKNLKLFAIVDGHKKIENYYTQQKLVNFQKLWFFRKKVNITQKNFDLTYLSNFEKKYGINIWSIAYSERFFTDFSRYHNFSYEEILSIIEQECRFFENILDELKPDYFITRVPDFHHIHLLHKLCIAKEIKPIILDYTRFGSKSILTEQVDMPIEFSKSIDQNKIKSFEELQELFHKKNSLINYNQKLQSSQKQLLKSMFQFLFMNKTQDYTSSYQTKGKTKSNVIMKEFLKYFQKYERSKYIKKNSISKIPNYPFIFFPLHLEPERTLLMKAPFYTNQLSLIENIAKSIPVDYKLLVKDHPAMQRSGWRPKSFYSKLIKLPNVVLIDPTVDNKKLFQKCSLVMTIAGTAGIEATLYGKPSIVFADVIYSNISSVSRIQNLEELPTTIQDSLKKEVSLEEVNAYLEKILFTSFDFDAFGIGLEFDQNFNFGGYLSGTSLSFNKLESFIEKHDDILEIISKEILKKISFK